MKRTEEGVTERKQRDLMQSITVWTGDPSGSTVESVELDHLEID